MILTFKKAKSFFISILLLIILSALLIFLTIYLGIRGSLPQVSGEKQLVGLQNEVRVDRDRLGIPTISGSNRLDVARAMGFLHAQDRYFQMDLIRRSSAGELSEIFGPATIEYDKQRRFHQSRLLVEDVMQRLSPFELQLLKVYTEGVNAGLQSLTTYPFEYYLLRVTPEPWRDEDCLLVGLGLFFQLQDATGVYDLTRGYLKELLPESVYKFFVDNGSAWEAALDDTHLPLLPIPPAEDFAYLKNPTHKPAEQQLEDRIRLGGSNQWVVQGRHTADGKTLVACDMHLSLSVPNIWYRVSYNYPDIEGNRVDLCGVSIPGLPLLTVGGNRHVAWGFTNAFVDTTDLIEVALDPKIEGNYLTEEGSVPLDKKRMMIRVKGQDSVLFTLYSTKWGPLLEDKLLGKSLAMKWVAHNPDCINLRLVDLEGAKDVPAAMQLIKKVKIPVLNFAVGDSQGNIGWTLVGSIPKRKGFNGKTPVSFLDGKNEWTGLLEEDAYPSIVNPPSGMLWTANNRFLGGKWINLIGEDLSLNGIRAYQIKKRLDALEKATPKDMLAIQLDDEAIFMQRWQALYLKLLQSEEGKANPINGELAQLVENWGNRSSIESAGYYWIRTFRDTTVKRILTRLLSPCLAAWKNFNVTLLDFEEPVWLLVSQQPDYLIDPSFKSWNEQLLAISNEMIAPYTSEELKNHTWGIRNTLNIQHPISKAVPMLSSFLDMQKDQVNGDLFMPMLMTPQRGASQRMVVSPGNEEEGIFHMPGGQSGNPLSTHYDDAEQPWVKGEPTSYLPGKPVFTMKLKP